MAARRKVSDIEPQIWSLISSSRDIEPGPTQVSILQEACRLADAHGETELAYQAREELISAATFGGFPEVALVEFAWCLAQFDRTPDRFSGWQLLWKYKWIAAGVACFPQIGRDQIEAMLADLRQRLEQAGHGLHPFYQTARKTYDSLGEKKLAGQLNRQVQRSTRDVLSDCLACEQNYQVSFQVSRGRWRRALELAQPIVLGDMACAEVPHATYARLLWPLVRLRDLPTAATFHQRGIRLIKRNANFLPEFAMHLVFLAITDNLKAAVKMLRSFLPLLENTHCPEWKFECFLAIAFALDRIAASPGGLTVSFPEQFRIRSSLDTQAPSAWRQFFEDQAKQLATDFDRRNGNDSFSRRLNELESWRKCVKPFPL